MKLLAFAASHRPESYNRKLAQIAAGFARNRGVEIDFAEYGEFDMPLYNDVMASQRPLPASTDHFLERMRSAAGIIVACPEYNWSYPASLKNIIDWSSSVDIDGLKDKTALMLCASTGSRGGIMGLHHLRSPLEALQMHVFHRAFPLGRAQTAFTPEGQLQDEKLAQQLGVIVSDFVAYTQKFTQPDA
ncbi:MAG: NADPH-dependent oxidoreductase [Proteobacteria bacterium]|nr:NADPH-dependent oxidoreductase [Pseudomonadota bacterium]